jgi:hypothetical protein
MQAVYLAMLHQPSIKACNTRKFAPSTACGSESCRMCEQSTPAACTYTAKQQFTAKPGEASQHPAASHVLHIEQVILSLPSTHHIITKLENPFSRQCGTSLQSGANQPQNSQRHILQACQVVGYASNLSSALVHTTDLDSSSMLTT